MSVGCYFAMHSGEGLAFAESVLSKDGMIEADLWKGWLGTRVVKDVLA